VVHVLRFKFLVNYFSGIKAFVEEWWQIIHEAADFDALRVFLLVEVQLIFCTVIEDTNALLPDACILRFPHWRPIVQSIEAVC
jgi:hypothetical protein